MTEDQKDQLTRIAPQKFEEIMRKAGVVTIQQKNYTKVVGPVGCSLYVPTSKRVGKVYISGFVPKSPGVRELPADEAHGSVAYGLDFFWPEAEVLANFELLLADLATQAPATKVRKTITGQPAGNVVPGRRELIAAAAEKARQERLVKTVTAAIDHVLEQEQVFDDLAAFDPSRR